MQSTSTVNRTFLRLLTVIKMTSLISVFIHIASVLPIFAVDRQSPVTPRPETLDNFTHPGDFIIGGLFPMHVEATMENKHCAAFDDTRGMHRVEAFVYAIMKINSDPNILPGLKLGVSVFDTCSKVTHALEQVMTIIKSYILKEHNVPVNPSNILMRPVVGIIGAATSSVTIAVAQTLRNLNIPIISYASTSVALSEDQKEDKYPLFSRVVPSDSLQGSAIVDIARYFNWTYMHAIIEEGDYGEKGLEKLIEKSKGNGLCIGKVEKIRKDFKDRDYIGMLKRIVRDENDNMPMLTNAIVAFVTEKEAQDILRAISSMTDSTTKEAFSKLVFVAADRWGDKFKAVQNFASQARGSITLTPKTGLVKDFANHFNKIHVCNNNEEQTFNKWVDEYFQSHFGAVCRERSVQCCRMTKAPTLKFDSYVPYVIDATNLLARALHAYLVAECGLKDGSLAHCKGFNVNGKILNQYIRNTTFESSLTGPVVLDSRGDVQGGYTINQVQRDSAQPYVEVGTWSMERIPKLELNHDLLTRGFAHMGGVPISICKRECELGYVKEQTDNCCFYCKACTKRQYIANNTCIDCEHALWPNTERDGCISMEPETINLGSVWAIGPIAFSVVGILFTLFTMTVFYKYHKTPIIMASGRELCWFMLIGIILSYLVTFIVLARPTLPICVMLRLTLGTSLCMCYAAIFTKTNRLARIFTNDIRSAQRPKCVAPKYQIIICLSLITVQPVGAIIWIAIEYPEPVEIVPDEEQNMMYLACHRVDYAQLLPLAYNFILMIACTVYAVRTRKIPENFNETRHIGFTCYSTCVLWLAFVPIYFGTSDNFRVKLVSICICISMCATVILLCFFAPKIYICLFEPHKNVRQNVNKSLKKAQYKYVSEQMKFFTPFAKMSMAAEAAAAAKNNNELPQITMPTNSDRLSALEEYSSRVPTGSVPETEVHARRKISGSMCGFVSNHTVSNPKISLNSLTLQQKSNTYTAHRLSTTVDRTDYDISSIRRDSHGYDIYEHDPDLLNLSSFNAPGNNTRIGRSGSNFDCFHNDRSDVELNGNNHLDSLDDSNNSERGLMVSKKGSLPLMADTNNGHICNRESSTFTRQSATFDNLNFSPPSESSHAISEPGSLRSRRPRQITFSPYLHDSLDGDQLLTAISEQEGTVL